MLSWLLIRSLKVEIFMFMYIIFSVQTSDRHIALSKNLLNWQKKQQPKNKNKKLSVINKIKSLMQNQRK